MTTLYKTVVKKVVIFIYVAMWDFFSKF